MRALRICPYFICSIREDNIFPNASNLTYTTVKRTDKDKKTNPYVGSSLKMGGKGEENFSKEVFFPLIIA